MMKPEKAACLFALADMTAPDGEYCVSFRPVEQETNLPRQVVRRHIRALARSGHAEFFRGLWTEYGKPAGSGYCITREGRKLAESMRGPNDPGRPLPPHGSGP